MNEAHTFVAEAIAKSTTADGRFVCELCKAHVDTNIDLVEHMRETHPELMPQRFMCEQCGASVYDANPY